MQAALISSQRDPQVLAEYVRRGCARKIPMLVEVLTGRFGEDHAFLCRMMFAHIDALDAAVEFQTVADRLDTIPGLNQRGSDDHRRDGVDMSRFPTAAHLGR